MSSDTWRAMWMTHGEPCGDTWQAMCHNAWQRHACVTHGMPCVNMHATFEAYIYGDPIQFVETSKGGRRRRKGKEKGRRGKEKGRKGMEKWRKRKEKERRKEKKKGEEERKKKEEKEGVLRSEQTR